MLFDELLKHHVGEYGRFQVIVMLVVSSEQFFVAFHIMASVFIAATPKYRCGGSGGDYNNTPVNTSAPFQTNNQCYWPIYNGSSPHQSGYNDSSLPPESGNTSAILCDRWEYDTTFYSDTVVTEWDLVCDRAWLVKIIPSAYLVGMLIGSVLFGWLSDKYGRKKISFVSGIPNVIVALVTAFSPNYYVFVLFRFLLGVFSGGKTYISFIIALEYAGPSWRNFVGCYYQMCWAFGYIALGGVCYLFRSWRTVSWIIALPEISYYVLLFFLVPESPRWLYFKGRIEEADKIMRRIARVNKTSLPEKFCVTFKKSNIQATPMDLVKTPLMRKITIILTVAWAANGITYYGISLNINDYLGDPYLNHALFGAIEIPAYLFQFVAFAYLGRVWPYLFSLMFSGIGVLISLALIHSSPLLETIVITTSKLFITSSFAMAYMYTPEVYPTCIRSTGLSTSGISSRISSSMAPFVPLLDVYHPFISRIVYGSVAILSAMLLILLPETKDRPLIQTISEAEEEYKKHSWRFHFARRRQWCDASQKGTLVRTDSPVPDTDTKWRDTEEVLPLNGYDHPADNSQC